ncbi:pimeloyl-ACP methyl ester esterase BioH [Dokdonella soli]|uniref:Pimeloyl-[acyl-carrier protein] methyl ester esterase n=1 Tax=Dokdonella soli TaxID=529810 RepID=A0ABN1IFQ9_9GAMM
MHIDIQGSGPDLVLIHGWAMHGGIFGAFAGELTTRFRVHVVDLPGHGYSRDDAQFEIGDCARRIVATTPRALWVGWSLGGLVALRAALDHPANVRGLGLIASSPRFVSAPDWPCGVAASVFGEFATELQGRYRHAIERFLALETMGSSHAQADLRALRKIVFERGEPSLDALAGGLRALEASDLRADLARLAMPSLWIAGRRDRLVPPAAMEWAAAQAPHGRTLEFNSGHAPFLEHAGAISDAISDAIAAFAAELPA